tara:strand:- start:16 stop:771 length:756 start_codon:yes stop_codon:yes gene_type:complete
MALEAGTHIDDLVVTNPASTDGLAQADDHIRLIKTTLKNTFPNVTGAVTATHGALNVLSGFSGTVDDLTYSKDLRATGVTATEFDYLDGVSSNIQTQLDTIQVIPTGLISLWSGAANAIPTGYVICDGTNSTPDLRNRFLIGAGSTYAVGATGGSADAIIPAHTHALTGASTDTHNLSGSLVASKPQAATGAFSVVGGQGGGADGGQSTAGLYTLADSHNHALSGSTDSTGVSATNANLPPYFALCYIMKT